MECNVTCISPIPGRAWRFCALRWSMEDVRSLVVMMLWVTFKLLHSWLSLQFGHVSVRHDVPLTISQMFASI